MIIHTLNDSHRQTLMNNNDTKLNRIEKKWTERRKMVGIKQKKTKCICKFK